MGEGGSRGREYIYSYDFFALLYDRNQHCKAIIIQLENIKGIDKKKCRLQNCKTSY